MTRTAILFVMLSVSGAVTMAATGYDRTTEKTITGVVTQVVSPSGTDGVVGVHLIVKTDAGLLEVQTAPAIFIGQKNFWFQSDDAIEIVGAAVASDGLPVIWARTITKKGATLRLRDEDGTPLWKPALPDADGCGVRHPVVR